jgi:phosphonate transport system ATP-binding protein
MAMAFLEVRSLRKSYSTGETALKGIDLTLDAEEFVAVLGPNGSGKSTLLRCINRLIEPDAGSVTIDGREITRLNKRELRNARRDMGMIFQEFNLIERLTVIENVLCGRLGYTSSWRSLWRSFHPDDIDAALAVCRRVGILDHITKRADRLSGGQRQRVGIARAIIQNPKVLLVDEPTSSLDPKIGREVMNLIRQIAKEKKVSVLIALHDVPFAMNYCDRIIGISGGEKVLDVKRDELREDVVNELYAVRS